MGFLTDQMVALTDGILVSSRERSAAILGVRESAARILSEARSFLGEIGDDHRDRAEQLAQALRGAAASLTARVTTLLGEFDLAHARRSAELGKFLTDNRAGRTGEVESLLTELGHGRAEIARQLADGLKGFVDQVHTEVSDLLGAARASRSDGSQATRERIFDSLSALRDRVATLAQESAGFLDRCEQAHREMAEQLRGALSESNEGTREQVRALLKGFRETQQRIAEDLRAAARLWHEMALARAGATPTPRPATAPEAGTCAAKKSPKRTRKPRRSPAAL